MTNIKKKCPFRKQYQAPSYHLAGNNNVVIEVWDEEFQNCIGQDCMSFYTQKHFISETQEYEDEPHCKLME